MEKIKWKTKAFNNLLINELYDLYYLRTAIFVVEQNCPYQEIDEKDKKAFHILGYYQNKLIAVARVLPPNVSYKEASIGRFAVVKDYRKQNVADELIQQCFTCVLKNFGNISIKISAQQYVEKFYNKHGFVSTGKTYLEDNIPHVEMLKKCNL